MSVTRLFRASATSFSTSISFSLEGMLNFNERRHHVRELSSIVHVFSSLNHRTSNVLVILARAARTTLGLLRSLSFAGRLSALQLALGLRAGGGLTALPVALGLFAHWGAHRLRSNARSTAVGRRANSLALGAILSFAQILRAANIALRLITVNLALSASSLFALNLALGAFAHRVALGRASGVIALPATLRMAIVSSSHRSLCDHASESNC